VVRAIQENDDFMLARIHVYFPAVDRGKIAERRLRQGLTINFEENNFAWPAQYRNIGQGACWFAVEISRGSAAREQHEYRRKGR
jgi:hypothetical protein